MIKNKIDKKKQEIRDSIKNELNEPLNEFDLNLQIPTVGLEHKEIVDLIKEFNKIVPFNPKTGRVSGCVYSTSENIDNLLKEVFPL